MKTTLCFLVIMLSFIPTSYTQVNPSHTKTRAGDGTAPINSGTNDSSALIADIAASYDAAEQSIELLFNKLTQSTNNDINKLKDQVKELNKQVAKLKEQMDKLNAMEKKIDQLGQLIQQLNQENKNGIQNLENQKNKAIGQANDLIRQKRSQDIPVFLQTIKIQTVKATQDSLKSINGRYSGGSQVPNR